MTKKNNNQIRFTERKNDNASILEGWSIFCNEYKPTELTVAERAVFGMSQIVQKEEKDLAYTTKECVRYPI